MTYFLERIAQELYSEYGNSLNRHCLVFPSRRAGLYFLKYLAEKIEKPVWTPSIVTINEFFRSDSSLQLAGNEILLFELYKVYRSLNKTAESFDEFYYWGDMLLNDFDDVDKYLVNASALFRNVSDLKSIDQQFGGLTDEQISIIRKFWLNFNPEKPTNEKSGFINTWAILNDLYSGFRSSLQNQNLAYEGMIFREMAEKEDISLISDNHWQYVHFIGFNALNECEKKVMISLKKAGLARFYWDYDNSYIKDEKPNSAGYFLKNNLKIFGNNMPSDWKYDTMLSDGTIKAKRRVIDTSSDVAQVKLISQLVAELPGMTPENAHHTAVILADENMLMPVLSSLPENIGDINITMGHPLRQSLVYTLIMQLIDLHRTSANIDGTDYFNHTSVISILKHALISGLMTESDTGILSGIIKTNLVWVPSGFFQQSESLVRIFRKPATPALFSEYLKEILSLIAINDLIGQDNEGEDMVQRNMRNEFIYRIVLSLNRLESIVNQPDVSFSTDTYLRILDKMLRIQSVPFSGEPLSGIQIMGILESRALDFKNLIILSVNEGVLPTVTTGSSFIPFSLREAFGLPSINHQESLYAYHFYRLLQRAENVTFTYNSNSEGLRSGEMSRFLVQMKYDPQLMPEFLDLGYEIKTQGSVSEILERNSEHSKLLESQYLTKEKANVLSPSAINTWLSCRMKFYYRYVNRLKEPDKISRDIDPAMLGNILHESMKRIYLKLKNSAVTGELIGSIIEDKIVLSETINHAIRDIFKEGMNSPVSGNELIVRDVLMSYILKILKADKSIAPFSILNLEESFSFHMNIFHDGVSRQIEVGGKVDRIDRKDGIDRIVDYKTGSIADLVRSLEDLFAEDRKKDYDGWLQTLLYCEAYLAKNAGRVVRPSVYAVKKLSGSLNNDMMRMKSDNKNNLQIRDYTSIRENFMTGLTGVIENIFDEKQPFIMTKDRRIKCPFCPYKSLCMR